MRRLKNLAAAVASAFVLASFPAAAEAQTSTVPKDARAATAKAVVVDETVPLTLVFYEPGTPAGPRRTGDKCEGDWVAIGLAVTRKNGLVISERADAVNGAIDVSVLAFVNFDGLLGRGPANLIDHMSNGTTSCYVNGVVVASGAGTCTLKDADFGTNNRASLWIGGERDYLGVGLAAFDPRTTRNADETFKVSGMVYDRGFRPHLPSATAPQTVTVDNVCVGAVETALPAGGSASFGFDVKGLETTECETELVNGECPGQRWRRAWEPLSIRDYEITFTPTQADEPYRLYVWFRNCSVNPCSTALRADFVAFGKSPVVLRIPFEVWGEKARFSVSAKHESTWGVGDENATVGFTLSVTRIGTGCSSCTSEFSWSPPEVPTRHPVALHREDFSNAPRPMLRSLTPW